MDIGSIASTASQASQSRAENAVQTLLLKKALEIQKQSAAQLIDVARAVTPAQNPPNLGASVDTFA